MKNAPMDWVVSSQEKKYQWLINKFWLLEIFIIKYLRETNKNLNFKITIYQRNEVRTALGFHFTLLKMAITRKPMVNDADKNVGKEEALFNVDRSVNWCGHCGNQYGSSL